MDNSHEYYMREALKEAQQAMELDEVPIGAVVVCRNQIISRAHNLTEHLTDPTAHAEMQAITAATNYLGGKYLTDCSMYVTIEPCPMCAGALCWSQIGQVVFGATDPKKGFTTISNQLLHPKTKVVSGILSDNCEKLMKQFFEKKR